MTENLQQIRVEIDQLDLDIQGLISRRAALAQEVATIKTSAGGGGSFYRAEREAQVLAQVMKRNDGPLSDEEMARLFREIMSACLALEEPLQIAYLGPEGTFTQGAALKQFGRSVKTRPLSSIPALFHDVESGEANYGVVPVENSTEGVITHTLDMFINSPLQINGEVELRIHHHLMGKMDSASEINKVYSHQQALAQCRAGLEEHLSGVEQIAVSSNAEAARLASQEIGAAAIAGDMVSHKTEYSGGIWAIVDIDLSKLSGKSKRINITLPERILTVVDSAASREGESRSGFLTRAALEYMEHHPAA